MADPQATVYFAKGKGAMLELVVPRGTHLADLAKAQAHLSKEVLPHISPRGCGPCLSGIPFIIREEMEEVARVDLKTGAIGH
jgi:hypothetical protein